MQYLYDLVVYIGRFQPKHKAHHSNTLQALQQGKQVVIFIGSSGENPRMDNPFSFKERVEQFKIGFSEQDLVRMTFIPIEDWLYVYSKWLRRVKNHARNICQDKGLDPNKIALLGYDKDNTSFYVHDFPEWDFINVEGVHNMSSTDVREYWYRLGKFQEHPNLLPESNDYFEANQVKFEDRFDRLRMAFERQRVKQYGPISMAVDAMVIKEQNFEKYILLVRRKDDSTLALPGGFLETKETLLQGSKRELKEETGFDIGEFKPTHISRVFDDPKRSQKGRVITQVFVWDLDKITGWGQGILPEVQGADDAQDALWLKISDLTRYEMHDDHYQIVDYIMYKLNGLCSK